MCGGVRAERSARSLLQKGVDVEAVKKIVPYNSVEVKVGNTVSCIWCISVCNCILHVACAF